MRVLASVPAVIDRSSPVNVFFDVDVPSVSVSDCEIVEPQAFSLSRERDASVALECVTKVHIEPPVKVVAEAVRNRPAPQSSLFKSGIG